MYYYITNMWMCITHTPKHDSCLIDAKGKHIQIRQTIRIFMV